MKNTNSAKYEIVFGGKKWVCKKWTSYAENTPFCFTGIYTPGRHPWQNSTHAVSNIFFHTVTQQHLKTSYTPSPLSLVRGFVHMSCYNWFWMSHAPISLHGLSLCVTTLKQLHHRELIWSQWCSAHTQAFKDSQPVGFSEDSEVHSNNSISKTLGQQERHADTKCFMCQEDTVISAGSTCIRKLKWNIMKSERIRILYKPVFCFIVLQVTAGIYHISQMESQIFKEQRDLI